MYRVFNSPREQYSFVTRHIQYVGELLCNAVNSVAQSNPCTHTIVATVVTCWVTEPGRPPASLILKPLLCSAIRSMRSSQMQELGRSIWIPPFRAVGRSGERCKIIRGFQNASPETAGMSCPICSCRVCSLDRTRYRSPDRYRWSRELPR